MKEAFVQRIIGHHVTPREAGMVFALTKPKLAAFMPDAAWAVSGISQADPEGWASPRF